MARWIWPIVVVASLVTAFAADHLFWPDRVVVTLYAIPIIIASLRWSPWVVLIATAGTIVVAVDDLSQSGQTTKYGAVSVIALLGVGVLAICYALNRQALQRKIQRQQTVITTVARLRQPLAVVLGYTQLLETRPPSETLRVRAFSAICRAALDLRDMLDDVMVRWGDH